MMTTSEWSLELFSPLGGIVRAASCGEAPFGVGTGTGAMAEAARAVAVVVKVREEEVEVRVTGEGVVVGRESTLR